MRTIGQASLSLAGLAALSAAAAWPAPVLALGVVSMAFAAAIRLYEAASGIALPARLTWGVAGFALTALLLGEYWDGYERLPVLDLLLHVVSAGVLAAVGMALALLPTAGARPRTALWIASVLAFGFAMMVGALWEVLEFGLDQTLGTNTQRSGLPDTMWDLIANTLGAGLAVLTCHRALWTGRALPPAGLLLDFVEANPVIYGAWRGPFAPAPPPEPRAAATG